MFLCCQIYSTPANIDDYCSNCLVNKQQFRIKNQPNENLLGKSSGACSIMDARCWSYDIHGCSTHGHHKK